MILNQNHRNGFIFLFYNKRYTIPCQVTDDESAEHPGNIICNILPPVKEKMHRPAAGWIDSGHTGKDARLHGCKNSKMKYEEKNKKKTAYL